MIDNDATIQSNKEKRWFRIAIEVFALGALVGITGVYLFILAWDIVQQASWIQRVFQEHAEASAGASPCALVALCAVLSLEAKSGPIEFEVLRLKFRGASGEIVLSVIAPSSWVSALAESGTGTKSERGLE